ncbi:MAG: energy-coupling factor transporter ATPase [Anaerolineae bacterium]|jgi:energy-coupling factor transport system ATP-binding protein|nr:energy-coupling factor transporter ATPase [Anaerolineae bacterium]MDH7475073.1 energy-coupling factor transporter ATPase [Anaerolineae bacterium]
MIEFENVSYSYAGSEIPVLRNLSLTIPEGDFVLVIGASGAGKSTFLRCLNGLIPHFYGGTLGGQVRVMGCNPAHEGPRKMARHVGFVFQNPEDQFVVETVEDELAFALENYALPQATMRKRIEEVLDQLSIAHLRHRAVSTLSGGEQQRVAIAAVLTLQPQVLVLDEPTSQLDPQAAEEVLDALLKLNRDLGLTIVLSEHRLERVVQYADHVLYLSADGESPVFGEPTEVMIRVPLTPPLVTLGKALGWAPLPLTIKDARRFVRQLQVPDYKLPVEPATSLQQPATSDQQPVTIEAEDVWFSYNGHEALRGVNLVIRAGEFVAVMGRNGSGKTTLLKHLVGLLKPQQGRVVVANHDTRHVSLDEIIARVGYVPQNPNALLFADTVREELDFTRRNHRLPPVDYAPLLRTLSLEALADRYPRDLSVGERQRVALASILVADPEVILLDEPTRGLDYRQKEALTAFLRAQKREARTVVMTTHDVELVANCADRVIILSDGQVVVDGPVRQVMTDSQVFASQVNKLFRDARFLTVEDVLG